jgi:hypothetical protein
MQNSVILIKVKQRLNKLASNDYDNIQDWQIVEAFNKAQPDWARRNLHGLNIVKEGDEQSTRRIDDMQVLLYTIPGVLSDKKYYYEIPIPDDYLQWKRVDAYAINDCCSKPKRMMVYLGEEANLSELLRDVNKKPSFEWGETFCTLENNFVQIYTNGEFTISKAELTYYRQPTRIQIAGVTNPYTGVVSTNNVDCEFKDDIVEVLIDETCKILANDIESFNRAQTQTQSVENNN